MCHTLSARKHFITPLGLQSRFVRQTSQILSSLSPKRDCGTKRYLQDQAVRSFSKPEHILKNQRLFDLSFDP